VQTAREIGFDKYASTKAAMRFTGDEDACNDLLHRVKLLSEMDARDCSLHSDWFCMCIQP
jgi:hypothetical protein